jgi:hypothetical protein
LKINIVSREESSKKLSEATQPVDIVSSGSDPVSILEDLMKRASVSFEKIQERLVKDGLADAVNFQSIKDIPVPSVFDLIDKMNTYLEKQVKKPAKSKSAKTAAQARAEN